MSGRSTRDRRRAATDGEHMPWRVLLLVHALRSVLALALAWPAARLAGVAALALPGGDAALFEDGGLYLAEVLRLHRTELASVVEGGAFSVMLAFYAGLFPLGMLLHAMAYEGMRGPGASQRSPIDSRGRPVAPAFAHQVRHLATEAFKSFGPLSFLLGIALAAMLPAVLLPQSVGALLETKIHGAFDDRGADLAAIAFCVVSLAMAALVTVVHDLARAAVVRHDVSGLAAARRAIFAFRARPLRATGAWIARALIGTGLVASGAWITSRLGVATTTTFAAVACVHQVVGFALLVLRANWLEEATEIVSIEPAMDA